MFPGTFQDHLKQRFGTRWHYGTEFYSSDMMGAIEAVKQFNLTGEGPFWRTTLTGLWLESAVPFEDSNRAELSRQYLVLGEANLTYNILNVYEFNTLGTLLKHVKTALTPFGRTQMEDIDKSRALEPDAVARVRKLWDWADMTFDFDNPHLIQARLGLKRFMPVEAFPFDKDMWAPYDWRQPDTEPA